MVVPSYYNGKAVTAIGEDAFRESNVLTSVVIPDTVKTIGEEAFYNCSLLISVVIGDGVEQICEGAFFYCRALCSVKLGSSIKCIDDHAFHYCEKMTSIVLPNGLEKIGFQTFDGCFLLSSVVIPDSVQVVDGYAFRGCWALISVTIGSGVTTIEDSAFDDCPKLVEIYNRSALTITTGEEIGCTPKNVYTTTSGTSKLKTVDDYVFYADADEAYLMGYTGEDVALTLPNGCGGKPYAIHDSAFFYHTHLTKIVIPERVTAIGDSAFSYCFNIRELTIGDDVKSIGTDSFYSCGLYRVTIGSGMESIASEAFSCPMIVEVYNRSALPITAGSEDHGTVAQSAKHVYTEEGGSKLASLGDFIFFAYGELVSLVAYLGSASEVVLPDGYEGQSYEIGSYAFTNPYEDSDQTITAITIPNTVTGIGDYAFDSLANLTSITIPDSVVSIGKSAFAWCEKVTVLHIGNGVKTIGESAFRGCVSLNGVVLGSGVESIGSGAFSGCDKLIHVCNLSTLDIVAGSGENGGIASGADSVCTTTEDFKLVTVGNFLFYTGGETPVLVAYTGKDAAVALPENYEGGNYELGKYVFYRCTEITSVVIPDAVTAIRSNAFDGCYNLASISIGSGVKEVESDAFGDGNQSVSTSNCKKLSAVYITDIAAWCEISFANSRANPLYFAGALYLDNERVTEIVVPDGVTKIGDYAFYGCDGIISLQMGSSVEQIGEYAFGGCSDLSTVVIGNGVLTIGDSAFTECFALYSVILGSRVESIGSRAFYQCIKLIEVCNLSSVNITAGSYENGHAGYYAKRICTSAEETCLATSGDFVFYEDRGTVYLVSYSGDAKEISLPDLYQGKPYAIGTGLFYKCADIFSVTIPDSVTGIGDYAFFGCNKLMHVDIPENAEYIGGSAFDSCYELKCEIVIPDGVTEIGAEAFNFSNITSIVIGKNVKKIGSWAFRACSDLKAVYITDLTAWCGIQFTDSLSNPLCEGAKFYVNGKEITELVIPADVTEVGNYAFAGSIGLTHVTIGEQVKKIGEDAFAECENLGAVVFLNTQNWSIVRRGGESGTPEDVTDAANNATKLKKSYSYSTWVCSDN